MFEADMKITAMHVKRKQLHQLLPDLVIPKRRKASRILFISLHKHEFVS